MKDAVALVLCYRISAILFQLRPCSLAFFGKVQELHHQHGQVQCYPIFTEPLMNPELLCTGSWPGVELYRVMQGIVLDYNTPGIEVW